MFYSDFVLSKKGPLARIWLAAHWDKKLTKAQIFETNIESSIERILKPKVKLALRTSGHLMLGVVRIYSRKTKYLLADCNEAFVKIKMAFRPGMVDLPEDHREAAVHAVTLPEVFHDFDSAIPDLNDVDIEAQFALNQSRADEITIHEDYANVPLHSEDGFDLGFDASSSDIMNHPSGFDESLQQTNVFMLAGIESMDKQKDGPSTSDVNAASSVFSMDVDIPKNHGFGGGLLEGRLFEDAPMLQGSSVDNSFQVHDLQDEPIPSTSKHAAHLSPMNQRSEIPLPNDDDDFDDDHFVPASPGGGSSDGSRPPSPISTVDQAPTVFEDAPVMQSKEPFSGPGEPEIPGSVETQAVETAISQEKEVTEQNENQNVDQTTLVQNEEESFALAPVDASALRGLPKTKRKRKLIVDEVKNISGEEMKAQLSDTSDIVITLDLAPPTKRLMHWKETGGVEKLFALPGKGIPSTSLFKNYQRHLTSRAAPNDDMDDHDGIRNDHEIADMPPPANPVPSKRGRKRKQPVVDELPQIPQNVQELPDRQSIELTETNDAVVKKLKTTDSPIEEKQPRRESEVAVKDPISLGARPDQDNSLQLQESMSLPTPNESLQEQAPEPMEVPPPYLDANQQTFTESLQIPPTCPEVGNDQPADNLLAFTPTSQPTQDMNQVPVGFEDNMSINNNDNTIMENMGYDERDNDMQQLQNSNLFQFNNDDNDNAPITPGMHPGAVTPWHDADYDNPASIGPMEERGIDETMEQFEERLLNKRAGHLYSTVRMRISTGVTTTFNDLIISNPKKQVAQKFYSLLVLKKHRVLELTQSEPYDVILLTKGPNFDDPKL